MSQRPLPSREGRAPRGVRPPGFLGMETNLFDRLFIGGVLLVAVHLLWMRFLESQLPLGIATALSLLLAAAIVRWG